MSIVHIIIKIESVAFQITFSGKYCKCYFFYFFLFLLQGDYIAVGSELYITGQKIDVSLDRFEKKK